MASAPPATLCRRAFAAGPPVPPALLPLASRLTQCLPQTRDRLSHPIKTSPGQDRLWSFGMASAHRATIFAARESPVPPHRRETALPANRRVRLPPRNRSALRRCWSARSQSPGTRTWAGRTRCLPKPCPPAASRHCRWQSWAVEADHFSVQLAVAVSIEAASSVFRGLKSRILVTPGLEYFR